MIKLWGNYEGVRGIRNQKLRILEYHRNLGFIFEFSVGFPTVAFFNGWSYYDAFFEVLQKSMKGEKSVPKCSKYKDR